MLYPRCHLPAGLQGPYARRSAISRTAYEIVLIGHAGHPEVIGTMGQLPEGRDHPGRDRGRMPRRFTPRDPGQPRLSSPRPRSRSTTPRTSSPLCERRFPDIDGPHKEDICYATTNRQEAVKTMAPKMRCDPGDRRAQHLQLAAAGRGGAQRAGCERSMLVQRAADIDWRGSSGMPRRRHHRRRLGPRGAGRGGDRRLRAALRRHRGARRDRATSTSSFKLPRELRRDETPAKRP